MTRLQLDKVYPKYPSRIKSVMGKRAPKHLDTLGNLDILDMSGIGFSGSRQASSKGLYLALDYAKQVAECGDAVISGNAGGIDLAAHYASLAAIGNTILVLPEGINRFYIKEDLREVWDWERVLVISQFDSDATWQGWQAMARNQLIVALSSTMIVFEAGEKGGTLDAGKQTIKAGVPLYVADSTLTPTPGNQILLDKGARMLTRLDEIYRDNENRRVR